MLGNTSRRIAAGLAASTALAAVAIAPGPARAGGGGDMRSRIDGRWPQRKGQWLACQGGRHGGDCAAGRPGPGGRRAAVGSERQIRADPADDRGHGTSEASLIAGRGDNGEGIAGVCWACKILPVKVTDANGSGTDSDLAAGIVYAADRGVKIIYVGSIADNPNQPLRDAVGYAQRKGASKYPDASSSALAYSLTRGARQTTTTDFTQFGEIRAGTSITTVDTTAPRITGATPKHNSRFRGTPTASTSDETTPRRTR